MLVRLINFQGFIKMMEVPVPPEPVISLIERPRNLRASTYEAEPVPIKQIKFYRGDVNSWDGILEYWERD